MSSIPDAEVVDVKMVLLEHGLHIGNHLPLALSVSLQELTDKIQAFHKTPSGSSPEHDERALSDYLRGGLNPDPAKFDRVFEGCRIKSYDNKLDKERITDKDRGTLFPLLVMHTRDELQTITSKGFRQYATDNSIPLDPPQQPTKQKATAAAAPAGAKKTKSTSGGKNIIANFKKRASDFYDNVTFQKIVDLLPPGIQDEHALQNEYSVWKNKVYDHLRSIVADGVDPIRAIQEWDNYVNPLYGDSLRRDVFYGRMVTNLSLFVNAFIRGAPDTIKALFRFT